jgi:serine/threonine protein kinase
LPSDAAPPLRDGRYRLVEVVGLGGMSTVYRAFDARLGVWRAVKVLSDTYASDYAVRAWFEEEASVLARLKHRNVVTLYDVDADGGRPYIVMDLCDGGSVMQVLDRMGRFGPGLAAEVGGQILSALSAAHSAEIIHRDVKPHNILFNEDDVPMLTDFGVARRPRVEWTPTTRRRILGTPSYMAPEQKANPERADARSDVYSMGLTLYVLLTGRQPFAPTESRDAYAEIEEINADLMTVVRRATAASPVDRFQTADEMREALLEATADLPVTAPIKASIRSAPTRRAGPPSMPPIPETWPPIEPRREAPAHLVGAERASVAELRGLFQDDDTLMPSPKPADARANAPAATPKARSPKSAPPTRAQPVRRATRPPVAHRVARNAPAVAVAMALVVVLCAVTVGLLWAYGPEVASAFTRP